MKKLLFFFALCAFLLCGCSESSTNFSSGLQKSNFFAMDTSIEFNIYGDASLLKEAQNVLTDLESEVSVTDPDSEIYKINQDGTGTLTGNAGNLMQEALVQKFLNKWTIFLFCSILFSSNQKEH